MVVMSRRNSAMRALRMPRRPTVACPPQPTPRMARPSETSCIAAMEFTSMEGWRTGVAATPFASRIRSVFAAARAMVTKASLENQVSQIHRVSKPWRSVALAYSMMSVAGFAGSIPVMMLNLVMVLLDVSDSDALR